MIRFVAIGLWECSLDPIERMLLGSRQDGSTFSCNLSKPEYRLLQRLLTEPGMPVSRDELTSHAWDGRPVTAGSLSNAVFNLRQAFGAQEGHQVIRTVPNQGYRIQALVLEDLKEQLVMLPGESPDEPEQAAVCPPEVALKRRQQYKWLPAFAVLVIANLFVSLWFAHSRAIQMASQTRHRLAYEYVADIGKRRFFAQVSPLPSSNWTERALKAFADYPPQRGTDKPYVYVNRGDSDDEFSFFLCQDKLEADWPTCSAYVVQRDPHS